MTIKIALTGAGYIANIHAWAIQAQTDAELVAVVTRNPEKAAAFAAKFGFNRHYQTVEELLQAGGVDALVICTPNALHAPEAVAALRAGLHIMVEKPMAMDAAEARQMIATGEASGALLMVAHCWRFDPEILWLKSQAPKLGQIIRTKGYGVHAHWGPSGWFTQKELAGGGAMADMGIHALDTARFLLDDPQPVRVFARISTVYGDYDLDDTGLIMVEWDNGATSYIESGWWQPHSDGPEAATQLYGRSGFGAAFPTRLELPNRDEKRIDIVDPGFPFPRPEHCPQSLYNTQMRYFIDCIHSGQLPVPGGMEGLINMRIVDAAYLSAKSGQVVELSREL